MSWSLSKASLRAFASQAASARSHSRKPLANAAGGHANEDEADSMELDAGPSPAPPCLSARRKDWGGHAGLRHTVLAGNVPGGRRTARSIDTHPGLPVLICSLARISDPPWSRELARLCRVIHAEDVPEAEGRRRTDRRHATTAEQRRTRRRPLVTRSEVAAVVAGLTSGARSLARQRQHASRCWRFRSKATKRAKRGRRPSRVEGAAQNGDAQAAGTGAQQARHRERTQTRCTWRTGRPPPPRSLNSVS